MKEFPASPPQPCLANACSCESARFSAENAADELKNENISFSQRGRRCPLRLVGLKASVRLSLSQSPPAGKYAAFRATARHTQALKWNKLVRGAGRLGCGLPWPLLPAPRCYSPRPRPLPTPRIRPSRLASFQLFWVVQQFLECMQHPFPLNGRRGICTGPPKRTSSRSFSNTRKSPLLTWAWSRTRIILETKGKCRQLAP